MMDMMEPMATSPRAWMRHGEEGVWTGGTRRVTGQLWGTETRRRPGRGVSAVMSLTMIFGEGEYYNPVVGLIP